MSEKEEFEKILKKLESHAEKENIKLNPDKKQVEWVVRGLMQKKKKFGEYYCPCRILSGNEEDKKKICPCFWHLEEIKKDGHCKCWLFLKK